LIDAVLEIVGSNAAIRLWRRSEVSKRSPRVKGIKKSVE